MRNRFKRKGQGDRLRGVLLATLGLALIAILGMTVWWVKKSKTVIDEHTLCPMTGPRGIHVVIFDRSDPISRQQAQRIELVVQEYKNAAKFGHRFDIYTFEGDTKNVLLPILSLCSPQRPEDANEFIENPDRIKKRYEENFSSVLDRTIRELLNESTRETSPIVESLKAAAITSFGPVAAGGIPLRVTLVSDMVQHSALYSHFKVSPDFAALAKDPIWPTLRPDLKGARVDILYLLRPSAKRGGSPIQTKGHQIFWEHLIIGSGGRPMSVEPL